MKSQVIFLLIIFSLTILSCSKENQPKEINSSIKEDSVKILIKASWKDSLTIENKLGYLDRAYDKALEKLIDTITLKQLSSIAYRYYQLKDTINFRKVNKNTLNLAIRQKDSFVIADTHWNYAEFFLNKEVYDTAYYHFNQSYIYFQLLQKDYESARMIYAMAFIKGRYRDYSGSEVFTIKAIEKFKKLNNHKYLYLAYNNLGSIQNDINEHDKALEYYQKAYYHLKKLKNYGNYYVWNLNNIGDTYQKKGDFVQALKFFSKALDQKPNREDYAMILDNLSYCKTLMGDTTDVNGNFLESLRIRDSLGNNTGVLTSKIRISEYYEYIKDTTMAVKFAKEANQLARKIKNGGDYLTTLKQLANLQPEKANEYLNLYSHFSDSLYNAERKTLNKFTRIEFETDEVIEKNRSLGQTLVWSISASVALLIVLSLLYFIRVQRVQNEKLFLETEQQKANEQVYLLTLKQQATLEEERAKERNRISQELHDGILGRLFGTRVGLGFLDLQADDDTQEQHEAFLDELQDIEKEIREVSHKLNDNFASPDVNFTTIVTQLLESKSQIGDFQFHLNIDENISWKSTDEIIKVNVYRIIQETLQNTIKHAKAKNVTLDFSSSETELLVKIEDDGVGFNQKKSKKGIGLKNMKSRVEKLNGNLEIASAMNKGTQIHIKIPLV